MEAAAELGFVEGNSQGGHADLVPDGLDVVSAGVSPVHDRLRILHLGGLVVVLHHGQLGVLHGLGSGREAGLGSGNQEVADGGFVTDLAHELPHDAHVSGTAHHAFVSGEVAGNDLEQGGLARSVGPDQRRFGAIGDLEGHPVEQLGAVGEEVVDAGNVNMGHVSILPRRRIGTRRRTHRSPPPQRCQPAAVRNDFSRGPLVVAPRPPSSTNTATARSPCVATIQAWVLGGLSLPNSAVPVLAPTGVPGDFGEEACVA